MLVQHTTPLAAGGGRRLQSRRFHLWLLGGLLLLCLCLYTVLIERQPTGWDSLGYQVAGRNIVRGIGPAIEHPLNETLGPYFTLAAFAVQRPQEPARLYLNYPPGFPLLLAIPQWLGLPGFFVLPILSTLGVLFTYLLGSLLFDRWTGLLGAAMVSLTPAYLEWGTSLWADLPGTCFMLGAVTAYVAAWRKKERTHQVLLCGVAGAMVVLTVFIKHSNALVLLPMFAYAVFTQRKSMFGSVANWTLAAIVVLGLVGVGLYNQAMYGGPLETSYAASRSYNFAFFSLSYALGPSPADGYSLIGSVETLWKNFSWLLIPAVIGLATASRNTFILLGGVFLVFLGLSSTFAWAPINVDTRYLLPLFAPVGLFAARGCMTILNLRVPGRTWFFWGGLIVVGVILSVSLADTWHRLKERNHNSSVTRDVAQDLIAGSEPDAIFLAYNWNDPINHFGDRTTLFYRRMHLDQMAFKKTLTGVTMALLEDGLTVYYVVDSQPPLADSLRILQQNFDLSLWKELPLPVYRISLKER